MDGDNPRVPTAKHGGKRPGAGRKPALSKQIQQAQKLAKTLKIGLELGLDKLASDYDTVMEKALEMAQDGNPMMVKTLLELLPKLVRPDDYVPTAFDRAMQEVEETVKVTRTRRVANSEPVEAEFKHAGEFQVEMNPIINT